MTAYAAKLKRLQAGSRLQFGFSKIENLRLMDIDEGRAENKSKAGSGTQ